MVKQLDELAVDVNETWSRKLKVVEDRVQQDENKRIVARGVGKEMWYQVLAGRLPIWLVYQGIKVVKFTTTFARNQIKSFQAPRAIAASKSPVNGSSSTLSPQTLNGLSTEHSSQAINGLSTTLSPQADVRNKDVKPSVEVNPALSPASASTPLPSQSDSSIPLVDISTDPPFSPVPAT
ncbi:hypothetical protein BC829DRAFT_404009 [Chytridium lagenaria]|nr:hypothetical protein BC829DRAFT_404009 [Chytridium lagenaria]